VTSGSHCFLRSCAASLSRKAQRWNGSVPRLKDELAKDPDDPIKKYRCLAMRVSHGKLIRRSTPSRDRGYGCTGGRGEFKICQRYGSCGSTALPTDCAPADDYRWRPCILHLTFAGSRRRAWRRYEPYAVGWDVDEASPKR